MILKPLEEYETLDNEKQKQIKEIAEKIIQELNSMKYGEDISFYTSTSTSILSATTIYSQVQLSRQH